MNLDSYMKKRVKYKIITSDTCTYCGMAKKLMENFNIDYDEENISKDKNLAQTIKEKYKTVPQIWNEKNEHIGGYTELRNHVYSQWSNVGGYKGD